MEDKTSISDSELEIMRVIWGSGNKLMLAPLMERLEAGGKRWKPNTVLTFLSRLVDKDMLRVSKRGRLNEYTALLSEKEYMESLTRSFLGKVYGGDAKGLVASLLRQDCLTPKDIAELQDFWNGGEGENGHE